MIRIRFTRAVGLGQFFDQGRLNKLKDLGMLYLDIWNKKHMASKKSLIFNTIPFFMFTYLLKLIFAPTLIIYP